MNPKPAQLTFCGGVGSVTGANFLLTTEAGKVLVDCGMFQGHRMCSDDNYAKFPYEPSEMTALIVTHAHIDHIGRIPKLVKEGFTGKIYSTLQTKDLARIMLEDAAHLVVEEARICKTTPPYTEADLAHVFDNWETVTYHTPFPVGDLMVTFRDAGHILGSALVECVHPVSGKIVFTGDLGNSPTLLLRDTEVIDDAKYMVIESVYGDRVHEETGDRSRILETAIEGIIQRKGTLLIPAFSIERTQLILYEINNLVEQHRIPAIPVFLDSPLAIRVTDIYKNATALFNEETKKAIDAGDDVFSFDKLTFVTSGRDSRSLVAVEGPKIIIAGSGMSHGGRIIHHERIYLGDAKNTLLIVGYQSPGSIGRQLQEGAKEITIGDERISVAANIETIHGFSGHRDVNGLIEFISGAAGSLTRLFVTMGEQKSSQYLAQRARDYLGVDAVCPQLGDTVDLL
ncbi:MAG: metallo-beta-lactamase family protein [Patescibacteria group bacterium]|jgi:metallo-beta-lactamase family protein|nr:metallo-beta-lactamase family protein [Patescibacteria group bacterium]